MLTSGRIWCVAVLVFFTGTMSLSARAGCDVASLPLHRDALQTWLTRTGLSGDLEVAKLRWTSDPSREQSDERDTLQLELLFRTQGTAQAKEDIRFWQFSEQYRLAYGTTGPERVFYKLVHECSMSPGKVALLISVLNRDYVFFLRLASAELMMQAKADRSTVRLELPLNLPKFEVAGTLKQPVNGQHRLDMHALPNLIETFLLEHFNAANLAAGLPRPTLHFDPPAGPSAVPHVGVIVTGIRGQVTGSDKFWEELEISIDVVSASEHPVLLCYFDGSSAAGVLGHQPSHESYEDMRKDYQDQLKRFADDLLRALNKRILAGAP